MELKGYKPTFRVRLDKRVPPKVEVTDAQNGVISIDVRKATKGKYQLELTEKDHVPIVLNIEVV